MSTAVAEVIQQPQVTKPPALLRRAGEIRDQALAIRVTDQQSADLAGLLVQQAVTQRKEIEDYWKPKKQAADEVKKILLQSEREMLELVTEPERHLKAEIVRWTEEQEQIAKAERDRILAEAQRQAEELQEKLLINAEDAGASPEEIRAMAEMPLPAIAVTIPDAKVKVAGVSLRKTWKGEVTNKTALIKFIAGNPHLLHLLEVSQKNLDDYARRTEGTVQVPGVRFFPSQSAGKAKG